MNASPPLKFGSGVEHRKAIKIWLKREPISPVTTRRTTSAAIREATLLGHFVLHNEPHLLAELHELRVAVFRPTGFTEQLHWRPDPATWLMLRDWQKLRPIPTRRKKPRILDLPTCQRHLFEVGFLRAFPRALPPHARLQ